MRVGLIGYPVTGKSTLYRAAARGLAKGEVTAVVVPDARFDAIVAQVRPKKATPATVILCDDLESVQGSGKAFSPRLLESARKADLLLHVVRAFDNPVAPYHTSVAPLRDQESLDVELVLNDLQIVENRLERLHKSMAVRSPGSPEYAEKALFERIQSPLGSGTALRAQELSEDDWTIVRNYQFLSGKPMVVAFNVPEAEAASPSAELVARCEALRKIGAPAFCACATLEEEIAMLDAADQPEFLASLGLSEPASAKVIRAVYDALGLITFFTAGDNETRAWPLRRGSRALKAAGTVHTDIARGFIRAEVVHYADYAACGSLDAAYSAGKMSLEGKEYVVRDGDLLHIRNKS
ncbi:MAG: redox-regulated ATPase YchF [Fimbriimonas ginsengisoli]|uniref:Redox-regulated ATPase YchF n=1 Tax=Fimbriimonas ginsengisoli TaxID=1005039 RepID=A0A931PTX8_FIMGI|nr:redox-regulated ATPase YchF [Fimbriimonas ginsengisoli]